MPEELAPNLPFYDPARGDEVRAVLDRHGESLRGQKRRTGIDHMTMKDMVDGNRVRLEKVEAFASGFGEDPNYWRERFGYEPILPHSPDAAADQLLDALDQADTPELTYETDWEGITAEAYLGAEDMSDNDRRRVMAAMQRVLEADKRRRERKQGKG